jgi:drug/metabolite transporter (DMT)-like permease
MITIKGEKNIGRGVIFYIIVFISNGMGGVVSTIHQNSANPVSSESYMIWKSVITVIMCAIIMLIVYKKINFESWKAVKFTLGYGLFYGVGNLFLLIALVHLSASVQYPLITGGTMVFSTVISIVRREKLTATTIISAILALAASIVIAF